MLQAHLPGEFLLQPLLLLPAAQPAHHPAQPAQPLGALASLQAGGQVQPRGVTAERVNTSNLRQKQELEVRDRAGANLVPDRTPLPETVRVLFLLLLPQVLWVGITLGDEGNQEEQKDQEN